MIIELPEGTPPIKCTLCHDAYASGVWEWTTSHFGHEKLHTAVLCAQCGIGKGDILRMVEPRDGSDPWFYKPNKNVKVKASFSYVKPKVIEHESITSREHSLRSLGAGTTIALVRNHLHDENVGRTAFGIPTPVQRKRRFAVTITCRQCGIAYSRVTKTKRCPGCGSKNRERVKKS